MIRFFTAILISCFSFAGASRAEIETVPHVDVERYLREWYQIAHIPLWFEGSTDCACARQRLSSTPMPDVIGVYNTCTKQDGTLDSISGTAQDDDRNSNAKFTVHFKGVPFPGTYWIIGLDAQYRFAVVTDKGGDALYILSKTPTLSRTLYNQAVAIAAKQVDTSKLVITRQKNCAYPN